MVRGHCLGASYRLTALRSECVAPMGGASC